MKLGSVMHMFTKRKLTCKVSRSDNCERSASVNYKYITMAEAAGTGPGVARRPAFSPRAPAPAHRQHQHHHQVCTARAPSPSGPHRNAIYNDAISARAPCAGLARFIFVILWNQHIVVSVHDLHLVLVHRFVLLFKKLKNWVNRHSFELV